MWVQSCDLQHIVDELVELNQLARHCEIRICEIPDPFAVYKNSCLSQKLRPTTFTEIDKSAPVVRELTRLY